MRYGAGTDAVHLTSADLMARVLMTTPTRGVMTTSFSDPKQLFATNKIILVPNGDFPSRPFTKPVESCRRQYHIHFNANSSS